MSGKLKEKPVMGNKAVPASYLFLRKGNMLLTLGRPNIGYAEGCHDVPSGHPHPCEIPTKCAIRDGGLGELGIIISHADLKFVHVMYRTHQDTTVDLIDFFYECRKWEGEIENKEPEKCFELAWHPADSLPKKLAPHIRHAFELSEKGIAFSELGPEFFKRHGIYYL